MSPVQHAALTRSIFFGELITVLPLLLFRNVFFLLSLNFILTAAQELHFDTGWFQLCCVWGEKEKWARLQVSDIHRCFLKAEAFYTEKIRLEIILLILLCGFRWLPAEVLILTSAVLHMNNLSTVGELPLSYLVMRGWFCLSFLFDRTRWETCPSKTSVKKTKYFELWRLNFILSKRYWVELLFRGADGLTWKVWISGYVL